MVLPNRSLLGVAGLLARAAYAQFPPTPQGVTIVQSQLEKGVSISYKQASHFCLMFLLFSYHIPRRTSARPRQVFEASPAMSIFPLQLWPIWASRTKPMRSIRISGSSNLGKTLQMLLCQFG